MIHRWNHIPAQRNRLRDVNNLSLYLISIGEFCPMPTARPAYEHIIFITSILLLWQLWPHHELHLFPSAPPPANTHTQTNEICELVHQKVEDALCASVAWRGTRQPSACVPTCRGVPVMLSLCWLEHEGGDGRVRCENTGPFVTWADTIKVSLHRCTSCLSHLTHLVLWLTQQWSHNTRKHTDV